MSQDDKPASVPPAKAKPVKPKSGFDPASLKGGKAPTGKGFGASVKKMAMPGKARGR
jgi:hypothetical protein